MISDKLIEHVKKYEGFKEYPYLDTVGKWTIGFGRNIDDNPLSSEEIVDLFNKVGWRTPLDAEHWAEKLMEKDLEDVENELNRNIPWLSLAEKNEVMVLMDLGFNIGVPRLLHFKNMLHAMDNDDPVTAAYELLNSRYATQTKRRAVANARILADNSSNFLEATEKLRELRPDIYLVLERWI